MVLPVKIMTADNHLLLVHTIDLSPAGVRIGSLREELRPGETVSLQRGTQKGLFRVVWVQRLGEKEFHAGLEVIEVHAKFWGVNLDAEERDGQDGIELLLKVLKVRR